MATLSFHAPKPVEKTIRAAAKKRGLRTSEFLRLTAEQAASGPELTGLGRELERLAIDALAVAALGRIRDRAAKSGRAKMNRAEIRTLVKSARAERVSKTKRGQKALALARAKRAPKTGFAEPSRTALARGVPA